MDFLAAANIDKRKEADLLVLPFWQGKKKAEPAATFSSFADHYNSPIDLKDFSGKEGETTLLFMQQEQEPRLALLGLGDPEKINVEKLRRAFASLVKICRTKKIRKLNIVMPHIGTLPERNTLKGVVEGLLLANYAFDTLKSDSIKSEPSVLLSHTTLIGIDKEELAEAKQLSKIAEGVYLTRDLVNNNACTITPQQLGQVAKDLSKKFPRIKTTVFDRKRIQKEKMGLLLAVSQGSPREPAFIIASYKGNPKSKDHTVLIGKGVTYDTGGLNLKPTGSMETMKCDMAGAAAVLGTLHVLASLGLKVNVTGVIPSTENTIGSLSMKPGDVYKSLLGKTIEIANTDAEGRLILADAFTYAVDNLNPSRIIDIATLTGAIEVALGSEVTGLMATDDSLAESLMQSGFDTYERLCRFPIYEEYRDALKSDIADMRNVGGRPGSAIIAASFLKEFVGNVPWAHLDIAGTAFLSDGRRYLPKFASGIGVRLFIDFLMKFEHS